MWSKQGRCTVHDFIWVFTNGGYCMKLIWHQLQNVKMGLTIILRKLRHEKIWLAILFHFLWSTVSFFPWVYIFVICWLKSPTTLQELDLHLTRLSHASNESKFPMLLAFLNWGPANQHVYEHCELCCSLMVQIYGAEHELSQKNLSRQSIKTSLLIWIIVRCHWSSSRFVSVTISMG